MYDKAARLYDTFLHHKQRTVYPGSLAYEVLEFMLAHKLASPGMTFYSNVRPLVERHGPKRVLQAIGRIRRNHRIPIRKPTNKKFNRTHVWELADPERIRLYPRRAPVSG